MKLKPINPPTPHRLPGACVGCGGEVRCDNGFADLDGEPFRAYYCVRCVAILLVASPAQPTKAGTP